MVSQRGSNPFPDTATLADLFAAHGESQDKTPSKFAQLSEPAQKAVQEKDKLLRMYRAELKEEKKRMLERGGGPMQSVVTFLEKAGPDDAAAIVETFKQFIATYTDPDLRQFMMRQVGDTCARIREACGLDALDDPLPDNMLESPKPLPVFHRCRAMMMESENG